MKVSALRIVDTSAVPSGSLRTQRRLSGHGTAPAPGRVRVTCATADAASTARPLLRSSLDLDVAVAAAHGTGRGGNAGAEPHRALTARGENDNAMVPRNGATVGPALAALDTAIDQGWRLQQRLHFLHWSYRHLLQLSEEVSTLPQVALHLIQGILDFG